MPSMGHGAGDAVMDPVRAFPTSLQFRLGIEFRFPDRPPPPPDSLLPARYLRIQVAFAATRSRRRQPLVRRAAGVRRDGGDREFDPHAAWKQSMCVPPEGISPFGQPPPETIVFDQWVRVPAVPPTAALTTAFTLIGPDNPNAPSNHFLSVPYPRPRVDGVELKVAGVNYFCHTRCALTRDVREWIAVSFDQFCPPERASSDYVVAVESGESTGPAQKGRPAPPLPPVPYTIDPAW